MKLILPIAITTLALVGCNSSQPTGEYKPKKEDQIPKAQVAPGQEAELFPVAVGNSWRYKMQRLQVNGGQRTGNPDDFRWEVRKIEDLPNDQGKRIYLETIKKDVVTEKQQWLLQKGGLFLEASGQGEMFACTPPEPIIIFPVELGKETTYEGKVASPFTTKDEATGKTTRLMGTAKTKTTTSGPEEVDTDMGRLSAFKVESSGTIDAGPGKVATVQVTMFFAPKVGLVRMRQTIAAEGAPVGSSMQMVLSAKTLMQ